MYKLKSSIITPSSGATDYLGKPINLEEKKDTILKTFEYLFKNTGLKKSEYDKESESELLWDMIKDPFKNLGLVAIDAQRTDNTYYALMFNLGIPRLRSRKFHKMPRIYMLLSRDTDSFCRFYNSPYDVNEEDVNLIMSDRLHAYHPHVSHGSPCFGNFSTDFAKALHNENPIMYLILALKFVNTWNSRSPFFSIHRDQQEYKIENKEFTNGQMIVAFGRRDKDYNKYKSFVLKNINKIDSGSIMSDLKYLKNMFNYSIDMSDKLNTVIKNKIDTQLQSYFLNHNYDRTERDRDNPRTFTGQHTIIPHSNVFIAPVEKTRELSGKEYKYTAFEPRTTSSANFHHVNMIPVNKIRRSILGMFSNTIEELRNHMIRNKVISSEFTDTDSFSIIDIYINYIAPFIEKDVELLNDINKLSYKDGGKGGGLIYLVLNGMNIRNNDINNKKYCIQDYLKFDSFKYNRFNRVQNYLDAKSTKGITKDIVAKYMDDWVNTAFKYEIETVEPTPYSNEAPEKQIIARKSGFFWNYSNFRKFDDSLILALAEIGEMPTTVYSMIQIYEKIKRSFVEEDAKQLIKQHNKQIGELEKYVRNNIKHTSSGTQQVHLSFESI